MTQTDSAFQGDTAPTTLETLLGTFGLAVQRLSGEGDGPARRRRVEEMRNLIHASDGAPGELATAKSEYDILAGYRIWSATYDRAVRLAPIEEPALLGLIDDLPAGSRVLDAGCGTGRYSAHLLARGHSVAGVDLSPDMLARARQKLPDVDFLEGQLDALPVEDATFDAAVCALTLVHLPDLGVAAREFARILRPGGKLLISDVHPFPVLLGWQAPVRGANGETGFMRLHPHLASNYITAFAQAGFTARRCLEPRHTEASARTTASETYPEANRAAWVGLPAVIVWEFEKTSSLAPPRN